MNESVAKPNNGSFSRACWLPVLSKVKIIDFDIDFFPFWGLVLYSGTDPLSNQKGYPASGSVSHPPTSCLVPGRSLVDLVLSPRMQRVASNELLALRLPQLDLMSQFAMFVVNVLNSRLADRVAAAQRVVQGPAWSFFASCLHLLVGLLLLHRVHIVQGAGGSANPATRSADQRVASGLFEGQGLGMEVFGATNREGAESAAV